MKNFGEVLCFEKSECLRTKENYVVDVLIPDLKLTGIKEKCIWNDLIYFNIAENYSCDPMHDCLEGICKADLLFLLKHFILDIKLFSIDTFNNRISNFKCDIRNTNIPPTIYTDDLFKGKLRLSASEMLFLVRYLPVFIGDFIPIDYVVWKLYLTLRKIINIVTAKRLQKGTDQILKNLISKHILLNVSTINKTKINIQISCHNPLSKSFCSIGPH